MDYYILGMSQKEFFQHNVFEEIFRERTSYLSKNQTSNFWISINPKILKQIIKANNFEKTQFYKRTKETKHYVCLISSNQGFINWIQLRLGVFENLNSKISNKEFYSDGVFFKTENTIKKLLKSNEKVIDYTLLYSKCVLTRKFIKKMKK